MTSVWKIVDWSGIAVVIAGLAVATYTRFTTNRAPWPAVVIMIPGVVMYHLGMRMMIREARKKMK